MSMARRSLDQRGRLALPMWWRRNRTEAVLMLLPGDVLLILAVPQLEAWLAEAEPPQRKALRSLCHRDPIDPTTGRILIPQEFRRACGFRYGRDVMVTEWHDLPWGDTLRVFTEEQWEQEFATLMTGAEQAGFPVRRVPEWRFLGQRPEPIGV